ncbi:toll/interleukin-1 receptor domain-containing protein [Sphingomonas sp. ABOLH]|uniref:toll/interleukin-1 receptor domain-containing protein n=1 Tax=Sphingomonas sp. ABOLH TaxID=1985881 RepID=UPI000F7E6BBF|nr:toll/interleukin-1 receptor domain-containing protein [Sphingomonas sp. ABOLH]RSV29457.1 toll/interleukin-1 receptor domain-containing protein [Sphingomonas sp. ABOLH]
MTTGFISYTHADTALKDQLVQHLAPLQREGLIDIWHDGMLRPGEHLDPAVQAALSASDLVILLVSAAFIASEYCYEQEMMRAFARQRDGTARVVSIILRPCQWKGVPVGDDQALSEFVALPKDGKPVISWPDTDTAFDNAVGAIREMLKAGRASGPRNADATTFQPETGVATNRPANASALFGIAAKPTDLDRDRFLREGFQATASLFEEKLAELKASDSRIDTDFERIDSRSFAASAYLDGKRVGQVSIWHGGDMWRNALCLSYDTATSTRNSMNDWLPIEDTADGLAFSARSAMAHVRADGPLDAAGAAAYFWDNFLAQVRSRIR